MKERVKRGFFLASGVFFVGLGIIGAFLPVMPTMPFMILALWCFARSSERFHAWLYTHRLFGPPLQLWEEHRVIPTVAKLGAIAGMIGSMIYVSLFSEAPWYLLAVMGVFMAGAARWLLSKPSAPPNAAPPVGKVGEPHQDAKPKRS